MNVKTPAIADLHCDLLCYLAGDPARTAFDLDVRCSIPQLRQGNVRFQTMAMFTETSLNSVDMGMRQVELFSHLSEQHPTVFSSHDFLKQDLIRILPAIENASAFCTEEENLHEGLKRLDLIQQMIGPLLYISLTWNTENRFGGGALTQKGLKEDGRVLLDFLHQKGIALDFSHASDALIKDALNYIDTHQLRIPVLASHSNFRKVENAPRNLPDELVKEIFNRKGAIGLNFVRGFVGPKDTHNFVKQLEHGLNLGGENYLCFGADFFYGNDVSPAFRKQPDELFFPDFAHAGVYPKVIDMWKNHLGLDDLVIQRLAFDNLASFLKINNLYEIN